MAIRYVDFANGNDALAGTSWATAKKTIPASGVSAGDLIKVAKSPEPIDTSIQATFGDITPATRLWSGVTATPQGVGGKYRLTLNANAQHGMTTGERVMITGTNASNTRFGGLRTITVISPTVIEVDGSVADTSTVHTNNIIYRMNGRAVSLNTMPYAVLENFETNSFQFSVGSLGSLPSTMQNIEQRQPGLYTFPASGITANTRYAWVNFSSTGVDLSQYSRLSMIARSSVATTATSVKLVLCSDTAGQVPVYEFPMPVMVAAQNYPVVIDLGGLMTNATSIKSVAIYSGSTTPTASTQIVLDNIVACKPESAPDALTHTSLIATGNSEDSIWYPITAFEDGFILIGSIHFDNILSNRIAHGENMGTYKIYRREAIKVVPWASTTLANSSIYTIGNSGYPNTIDLQGGWDPATDTKTGYTWLDGLNGVGYGLRVGGFRQNLSGFSVVRFSVGLYCSNNYSNVVEMGNIIGCSTGITANSHSISTINVKNVIACDKGVSSNAANGNSMTFNFSNLVANNAIQVGGYQCKYNIGNSIANNIEGLNISNSYESEYRVAKVLANARALTINSSTNGDNYISLTNVDSTLAAFLGNYTSMTSLGSYLDARQSMTNFTFSDISVPCIVVSDAGYLVLNATAGPNSTPLWTYTLMVASARHPEYPFDYRIARVALKAGETATFKLAFQTANTNLFGAIGVRGGLVKGVEEKVSSPVTGTTFQDASVTVTATETGVVEVYARCYGSGIASGVGNISFNNFRVT